LPWSFFITVVYGAKIWSSWFCPLDEAPLGPHDAQNFEHMIAERAVPGPSGRPRRTGFCDVAPERADLAPRVTSASVKNAPYFVGQLLMFW
jgi:hypothetical protein